MTSGKSGTNIEFKLIKDRSRPGEERRVSARSIATKYNIVAPRPTDKRSIGCTLNWPFSHPNKCTPLVVLHSRSRP
eukprot:scaffold192239_cov29-Tisochrysis_lutea.AAC.1